MLRTQFVVVQHDGQWKIRFEGRHHGPYNTQRDAIRAAIDAAQSAGSKSPSGHPPRVMVQSTIDSQKYRVEWTYGEDPYPPLDHSSVARRA